MQPDDIPEMNSSTPWENAVKKWRKKMQSGEEYKETPEAREAHMARYRREIRIEHSAHKSYDLIQEARTLINALLYSNRIASHFVLTSGEKETVRELKELIQFIEGE
jgi:hypothetical protein